MKPVQFFTLLGVLVFLGASPHCLAETCGPLMACLTVDACVKLHRSENLTGLLFPCGNVTARTVCCPNAGDAAKKIKARINTMNQLKKIKCGEDFSERIKNGHDAKLGEFPWMALLGYSVRSEPNKIEFSCGGSLITKLFILTAAHCLTAPDRTLAVARLGELDQRTDPDCISAMDTGGEEECHPKVVTRKISRVFAHERYAVKQLNNDIALLKMDQPVDITEAVRPICLPFGRITIGADVKLRVSGWGKLDHDNDEGSSVLKWAYLNSISNEDCSVLMGTRKISTSQICTSGSSGQDACKGDSGGPLIFLDLKAVAAIQVGIVSFGLRKCGTPNTPTVFTRVSEYTDWILDTMERMR